MPWREELSKNITTLDELRECIQLSDDEEERLQQVIDLHPMTITRYYLSLIDSDDLNDPIRKMAIPSLHELDAAGLDDTSGEESNTMLPGVQHKYSNTVLVLSSNICSMYCRHCFRKRMVGLTPDEVVNRFADAVAYVKEHKEVNNVLVSGGDSFILPTKTLEFLLDRLVTISHLDYNRFGTRMPVVYPDRILKDPDLLRVLSRYSKKERRISISTQFNHPREITPAAIDAIDKMLSTGVTINNQSVLLKGVNDDPIVLADLQRNLVSVGVNPYYVFQCRPVSRVKNHFQIPLVEGMNIVDMARNRLDGISKRFRYSMSHETGKIEMLGVYGNRMFFKYQQSKYPANNNRLFITAINYEADWLDELEEV